MTKGEVIKGTLVLIAPKTANTREVEELAAAVQKSHGGPVIVLPRGWKALPGERLLEMLAGAERPTVNVRASDTTEIGTTKPPPPPPPP